MGKILNVLQVVMLSLSATILGFNQSLC